MPTEIELKAHVQDSEALRLLLTKKADYLGTFEKDDTLWYSADLSPYGVRIRKETRRLPDGTSESKVLVTFKSKEVKDGIEINEEREFEVNPVQEFEELLRRMMIKPGAGKRKQGWAFYRNGITIELLKVDGLGWFVELEILAPPLPAAASREETLTEAKTRLIAFLDELGIPRESIESRSYLSLLNPTVSL
ncbi:MAG: class IV adenylate cyclase [Treponema sp.]|nr:class IV adenylate cyclase [Treponema sp.]